MNFIEKVRQMKPHEIVQAMIDGLKRKWVVIDMVTFGHNQRGVCYGCAATNAICQIIQKPFIPSDINYRTKRASSLNIEDIDFLKNFELAINFLRTGRIFDWIRYLSKCNNEVNKIPGDIIDNIINHLEYELPILDDDNYHLDLPKYQEFADALKEAGY